MNSTNSSERFDPNAHRYCPNVTFGWELGFNSVFTETERNKMILDVGCGVQAEFLQEAPNIYGIDPNLGTLRFNGDGKDYGKVSPYEPERCVKALAEKIPFKDGTFDYAFSTKAVGWYPRHINFEMAVREMLRVVKKDNGVVFFNIGQEMTDEVLSPVLKKIKSEGYHADVFDKELCVLSHPEHAFPKNE